MRRPLDLPDEPLRILHLALALLCGGFLTDAASGQFTPLIRLPAPTVTQSAEAYPGGGFIPAHLVDGNPRSEYSSNGRGTNTFLEFDFGAPRRIGAVFHRDRNDPATILSSELTFLGAAGEVLATVPITHVNQRAGLTYFVLPTPVLAPRVRWRVSALGSVQRYGTVGGAEIAFFEAGESEALPSRIGVVARTLPMVEKGDGNGRQTVRVEIDFAYAERADGVVRLGDLEPRTVPMAWGSHAVDFSVPAADTVRSFPLSVSVGAKAVSQQQVTLRAPRRWEIHVLPHSHVDIGYTALQPEVVKKQNDNIDEAMELVRATRGHPEGSRFKWNVEVLWPVENYLRQARPEQRAEFLQAVKAGEVGLDALYGNLLTGLCRPEELLRMLSYATKLSAECGVPVESAMISDVPGYTWSTVSALAHAGVKYFSFAPNYFDRMGATMVTWQNKPFYWKAADGRHRVLCWCPSRGYALGHLIGDGEALARFIPDYLAELETTAYPFDLTHLRWNVHGDNGSPDRKLADVVRDWNARYAWPKLTLTTTAASFREFERRHGKQLPEFSGDYTPYWEDGAGSSARETAMNRASAERLVQAETVWAAQGKASFPAEAFQEAWRNVLLYSEHTWGAHNSISQPDLPFVTEQWKIKQAFALDADRQSRSLLETATAQPSASSESGTIVVMNSTSWERTDLVTLPSSRSSVGDRVVDAQGRAMTSQRLSSGELVFMARDVPALGSRTFRILSGTGGGAGRVEAKGSLLVHPDFTVRIDEQTGAIASLKSRSTGTDLVDGKAATALNDYFYLAGADTNQLKHAGRPRITAAENGPLVAALRIESEAPGCRKLIRTVRVVDGLDRIEIVNEIDKLPVRAKEGVHFGFGFNVPQGQLRLDVGWAVVRPEVDQIPAACKNWFSVQRWVDISNDRHGVTLATLDAPLIQVGGITANLIGSQTDHRVWIEHLAPSQTVYSWVMNNHWHTNYRADQEGPTVFQYALRPHRRYSALEAARFGTECSQPLLLASAAVAPRLTLTSDRVIVTAFKPSDDGQGSIVRLFGAAGTTERVRLKWAAPVPSRVWLSDVSERRMERARDSITVPAWGIVTVRAEK